MTHDEAIDAVIHGQADELRALHRERAHLVAHLAAIHPSHVGYTDPNEPDWAVVTVQTPTGQMTWHIASDDMDLFETQVSVLLADSAVWDGHTTEQKYERLRELTQMHRDGVPWA